MKYVLALALGAALTLSGCASTANKKSCAPTGTCCSKTVTKNCSNDPCCKGKKS